MVHTKRMLGMLGILSVLALTVGLVGCKKEKVNPVEGENTQSVEDTRGTVDLVGTWEVDTMYESGLITKSGELMWLSKRDNFGGNPHAAKNATVTVDPEGKVTLTGDFFEELKYVSHHWNGNILTVIMKIPEQGGIERSVKLSFLGKDDCLYGPFISLYNSDLTNEPLPGVEKNGALEREISSIGREIERSNAIPSGEPGKLTVDEIDNLKADVDILNKMLESSEGVYAFEYVFKKKK